MNLKSFVEVKGLVHLTVNPPNCYTLAGWGRKLDDSPQILYFGLHWHQLFRATETKVQATDDMKIIALGPHITHSSSFDTFGNHDEFAIRYFDAFKNHVAELLKTRDFEVYSCQCIAQTDV